MTEAMDNLIADFFILAMMAGFTVFLGIALAAIHDAVTFLYKRARRH